MEEQSNLTKEEVMEVIKDFPIKPHRNRVIVTVNTETVKDNELNLSSESLCESQYIIAPGGFNDNMEAGQKIMLDLAKMAEKDGSIKVDPVEVNGRNYMFIYDSLIKADDNR